MIAVPAEQIRKYISYSLEKQCWIHDPDMPEKYIEEFNRFVQLADQYNKDEYE